MLPLADPQRFVGRHRDLVVLGEAFENRSRLITLHGPSGVGKSRMASEHLHAVGRCRRVLSVELSRCENLSDAFALVASRIGAPPATGRDPALVLGESLRELGPTTLVLDAVDGLREPLCDVLPRWHKASVETHVLLTAERPLGIEDEAALAVVPLALPSDVSERVISDALRLWHISRGVAPLRLPKTSDPELVRLLRALGGLPLAIEIAAAHSDRLTPFALLERLPRTTGAQTEDSAQAVLLPLLDLVWSLLSKNERLILAECSVFASGFGREAARRVIAPHLAAEVDTALDRLVRRRLLLRSYVSANEDTLGLHDQVRRYARGKLLALDPSGATWLRHATFTVDRGTQCSDEIEGPDGPAAILALIRMQPELMSIVARRDGTSSADRTELSLRALCIHDQVLFSHGPVDADLARFETWLQADSVDAVDPLVRAEARSVLAFVRARTGHIPSARTDLTEAERLVSTPAQADSYSAGRVWVTGAFVALMAADLPLANTNVERALTIAARTGHARLEGIALGVQSLIRRAERKLDEAFDLYERALGLHRSVGNVRFEGIVLTRLAQAHLERGELAPARERAEAARAVHRTFGDRAMEGMCLVVEGTVCHAHAELDGAREALEAARPLLRAVGDMAALTSATASLGAVRAELGDLEVARALFEQTVQLSSDHGFARQGARAELWCANLAGLLGDEATAVTGRQERAIDALRVRDDVGGPEAAALSRVSAQLAQVRRARSDAQPSVAGEHLATARASLFAARLAVSRSAQGFSFAERHALLTELRFTELLLAAHDAGAVDPQHTLRLPFHALWFVPPRAERTEASSRTAMRRILVHLAVRATAAPRVVQSAAALFAAGWPGENPGEENARLQVHAALGGLRKAGLGELLVAEPGGHFLDPTLCVTWVA